MSENADAVQVGSEPAAAVVENVDAVQEPAAAARDVGGATTQAEDPNLVRSVFRATCAHPQSLYATGERLASPKETVFLHQICSGIGQARIACMIFRKGSKFSHAK